MPTILIVDDQDAFLSVTGCLFMACGYETFVASNGGDALRLMAEKEIDVALVDVYIPQMDGFDVCRAIGEASRDLNRPVPIMWMMTGGTDPQIEVTASEVGAEGVLRKPFDLFVARSKIEDSVGKRRRIRMRKRELSRASAA